MPSKTTEFQETLDRAWEEVSDLEDIEIILMHSRDAHCQCSVNCKKFFAVILSMSIIIIENVNIFKEREVYDH